MHLNDPISDLHRSLGHAEHVGFPDVTEEVPDYSKRRSTGTQERPARIRTRRPRAQEIEVCAMFPQTWESTALGFGGIGGAAMTTAYTIALRGPQGDVLVYFVGRFAYRVSKPNETFSSDLSSFALCGVDEHQKYERKY